MMRAVSRLSSCCTGALSANCLYCEIVMLTFQPDGFTMNRPGHYDILDRRSELIEEEQQLLTFENTGRNASAAPAPSGLGSAGPVASGSRS